MNGTVAMITARGLLGRRRFLLLLALPLALVALTGVAVGSGVSADEWAGTILVGLGFAVVVPLVALIVGTGVFGTEIDDGTLVHVLSKPLPRWQIVLTKFVVAVLATGAAVVPAMFVAGALTDGVRLGAGLAVGTVLATVVYCALFTALGLVSTRPVLLGLAYVLVWEGILGGLIQGTRVLAVRQYALAVADRVAATDLLTGEVSVLLAVVMTAVLTAGAVVLAVDRLRSFRIAGETG
jgi:ABC-2 type transport system permease protein